jgi:hypothetical protein
MAGGLAAPQVLAVIQQNFHGAQRTRAIGLYTTASATGYLVGALGTGALLQARYYELTWQWGFVSLLPAAAFALVACWTLLPHGPAGALDTTDWVGIGLTTGSAMLVLVPLIQGRQLGWPAWCFIMLAGAPLTLLIASRHARARSAVGSPTLLDPRLVGNRSFLIGCGLSFVVALLAGSVVIWVALTLQLGLRHKPFETAAFTALVPAAQVVGSHISARAPSRRFMRNQLVGGTAILICAILLTILALPHVVLDLPVGWLTPGFVSFGFGLGVLLTSVTDFTLRTVPPSQTGRASGLLQSLQQSAGAVGVAVLGLLYFVGLGSSPSPDAYVSALVRVLWASMAICVLLVVGHIALRKTHRTGLLHPPSPGEE